MCSEARAHASWSKGDSRPANSASGDTGPAPTALASPALRKPGAGLSAATAAEVDRLMNRLARRLEELG